MASTTPIIVDRRRALAASSLVLLCAGMMSGCGGGGSSSPTPPAPPPSSNLSGVVQAGPVAKALVSAYAVDSTGTVGTSALATTSTDTNGSYSLSVGSYTGTVQLVATVQSGTTMADEASGLTISLPSGFALHSNAVVAAAAASSPQPVAITPFTELANSIAKSVGGLIPANIVNANGVVFNLIGMDPVATIPVAANSAPPAGASEAQKRYGLFNAAVSQLASSTPATTDPGTLACFTAAGTDTGARIQCATTQIANAVTVTGSGTQAAASGNVNLVGLSSALLSASASSSNQSGTSITDTDSFVATLQTQESAAISGTPAPIVLAPITQQATDVATAKTFFSNLRTNAAALQSGPFSTGIVDGMKAFGDSLNGDLASFTVNTGNLVQLVDIAHTLWLAYTTGATSNPNTELPPGNYYGCTIYQGSFPTAFGGNAGANGQPYVSSSVVATSPTNASWIGCSVNTGPLLNDGTRRYRQTMIFDLSTPAGWTAVNYLAITRSQYVNPGDGQTYQVNDLSPTFSGTVGITTQPTGTDNGLSTINGYSIKGDLPPEPTVSGTLLAARYPIDVNLTLTVLASGADQLTLSSGQVGVVPVGGSTSTLSIDLSSGGQWVAIVPVDVTNAAQWAASKISIDATISEPNGVLTGTLLFDQAVLIDNNWQPGHAKFTGSAQVAPVVAGKAGALVSWVSVTLEATHPSADVSTVSFAGNLDLPGLAPMTLQGSVNQTSANDFTLQASYLQNSLNVTITGTQHSASDSTFTFADASGVSVTLTGSGSSASVTVSGRQTAVIAKGSDLITYSDGTFETLVNP